MDYSYFDTAPQAYHHFVGMTPTTANPFPHAGIDADTINSMQQQEPLHTSAAFLPPAYDAFSSSYPQGLPTTTQGSPDLNIAATPIPVGSVDSGLGGDMDDGRASRTRSSSEEKEFANLTPAQSRRKAQNRAAQRAFRERKERHVRDLEAKLNALENCTHSLQSDNDRLKIALQRARTENEILRATSGHSPSTSRPTSVSYPSPGAHLPVDNDDSKGVNMYNVQLLPNGSVLNSADNEHVASRRTAQSKEVPASETWDLIQSHPLVQQGLVNLEDVCARLKGTAKCDGHGPVFDASTVWQAVEEAQRSGGDELI